MVGAMLYAPWRQTRARPCRSRARMPVSSVCHDDGAWYCRGSNSERNAHIARRDQPSSTKRMSASISEQPVMATVHKRTPVTTNCAALRTHARRYTCHHHLQPTATHRSEVHPEQSRS